MHFIMIMWSVQQEKTTIVNVYVPNDTVIVYVKLIVTKLKEK